MEQTVFDRLLAHGRYFFSRWPVLLYDALVVPIAWLGAYWFRFNLDVIPGIFLGQALAMLPLVIFWHLVFFAVFGVHRGAWRFTAIPNLWAILKSVAVGTAVVAISIFFLTRLLAIPRSVFPLHAVFLIGLLIGSRVLYRLFRDRQVSKAPGKRVLIVGAGAAGDMLVRDIRRTQPAIYEPIGFLDDDHNKKGTEIQGVRVLDRCSALPQLVKLLRAELILIAIPSANSEQMRGVVEYCEKAEVPFRTLPKVQNILDGTARSADLRTVGLDDLLGREPVSLDWQTITQAMGGRRVLITGGGGSIGSELCRQVARLEPSQIILVEQNEFNLYSLGLEIKDHFPGVEVAQLLGDVCDKAAVERIFSNYPPDIVFHAAAYKHVPMLQEQARETVRNNVIGTLIVARAALASHTKTMALISTDKAVNPTSMMGVSKRLAEIAVHSFNRQSATAFVTVRFGNVLGSAGSVVPLFERQIRAGGPITVTHPDMTRYFMTIAEACQLILQACTIGKGGEIFVLNMGEPVKVDYLARQMIRLSGHIPGEEIEITYTGLRPGEKLAEELFHPGENLTDTGYEKILLAENRPVDEKRVTELMAELDKACNVYNYQVIDAIVSELVPEYRLMDEQTETIADTG